MVLKADQDRVRKLIKDTLTLLCKNGLTFDLEFSIEALIGVTLDNRDVFLVNINEQVKSEKAKQAEAEAQARNQRSEAGSDEEDSENDSYSKKRRLSGAAQRRKRKKLVKSEFGENGDDTSDDDNGNTNFSQTEDSGSNMPDGQRPNQSRTNIKQEAEEDDDDEDNVIVIKEEMEDSWQQDDQESFGQFANVPGTSQDQNFPSLSDMSLMPVGPQDASQVWAQSAAYASPGSMGRGPGRMMNTSSGQIDPSQETDVVYQNGKQRFRCGICGSTYSNKWNLRLHARLHDGKYPYYCPTCEKGCGSTTQLKKHMSLHTGKVDFQCKTCGAEFRYKKGLTEHTKVTGHEDDFQYRGVVKY